MAEYDYEPQKDDPKKLDYAPPPTGSKTMVIVRIVFGVLGVIAILMGLAMTLEGGVHYNRYGTAVPS